MGAWFTLEVTSTVMRSPVGSRQSTLYGVVTAAMTGVGLGEEPWRWVNKVWSCQALWPNGTCASQAKRACRSRARRWGAAVRASASRYLSAADLNVS